MLSFIGRASSGLLWPDSQQIGARSRRACAASSSKMCHYAPREPTREGGRSRLLTSLPLPALEAGQLLPKVPLQVAQLVARGVGGHRPRLCLGQLPLVATGEVDGTSRRLVKCSNF